jgi:hypothetical protein
MNSAPPLDTATINQLAAILLAAVWAAAIVFLLGLLLIGYVAMLDSDWLARVERYTGRVLEPVAANIAAVDRKFKPLETQSETRSSTSHSLCSS